MAKQKNNFKRMRKLAGIAEHNRKYGLQQAEEHKGFVESDGYGRDILPPSVDHTVKSMSLGELFHFADIRKVVTEADSNEPAQG